MSFLAPWFLLGAAIIAGPIIFHLIRRASRNRVRFSATKFLEASPPRLQKRRTVQHPFLLLLRCLIIVLLAFGFARPFFKKELPVVLQESKPKHTVILLDESASMRQTGVWEQAKARLIERLEDISSHDHLSILAISNTVSHILSYELWEKTPSSQRLALAKNILSERQPGWGATHLDQGIEAALDELEQLAEISGSGAEKLIVVVSDFGEGARISGLAGRDWPADCVVHLESVNGIESGNTGMQWLGWLQTEDSGLKARLQLISSGEDQSATLQAFDVENGLPIGDAQSVYLPIGEKRMVLHPFSAQQSKPAKLELRGDRNPFDDQLWVAPKHIRQATIHYIGSAEAKDSGQPRFYLERAIAGWEDPVLEIKVVSDSLDPKLNDLIFLAGIPPAHHLPVIKTFLASGGICLCLLTDVDQLATIQELTGESPWKLNPPSANYALLGEIDFQHELFNIFADPRYSNFSNIRFWDVPSIQLPENSQAKALTRFDDQTAALVEVPVGKGQLYVWSGDWTPRASQWVLSSKFVPWLQRLIEKALGGAKSPSMILVGEAEQVLRGETATWQLVGSSRPESFTPQKPGLYRVSQGDSSHWVALNLPPQESRLDPLPYASWEKLGVPLKPRQSLASDQAKEQTIRSRTAAELEGQQKLWRWLLLVTALILATESLVAMSIAKRGEAEATA